jgi:hypothetical protein
MDHAKSKLYVEKLLPTFCQVLAMQAMAERGDLVRQDVSQPLHTAIKAGLKGLKEAERDVVVAILTNTVYTIMRGEGDDPKQTLLSACMFALKLVDEGLTKDPQHQSVLVGLLLLEEAKIDPAWGYNAKKAEEAGGRILSRCRLLGLF